MRRRSVSSLVSPGPARADAAAEPRQRGARAGQTRQQVFQLRQLDLQLPFARPRPPREDVEDQLRAVDDLATDLFFDLPQLRRRQLVVEDDEVGVRSRRRRRERLDLAGAEERRRIGLRPLLQHAQHDLGARRPAARPASSSSERSASSRRARPAIRPTSAARSRSPYRAGRRAERVQPCLNVVPRNGAGAHQHRRPPVTSTIVDGGRRGVAPGIDQQIDPIAERPLHRRRDRRSPARR